jgi:hypothetical protein
MVKLAKLLPQRVGHVGVKKVAGVLAQAMP